MRWRESLDGIRVLELARYQAGPRGGMILSDLGAEVIKIEKLGGEETRKSEPLVRGQSVYFSVYNRGKKSLCLDMRTERGKEIFAALVPTADIVLQNFRPGVMEKMGFGYDAAVRAEAATSSSVRSPGSANTAPIATARPSIRWARR